jgi:CBS domain containing-hemolysin-like protein
VTVPSLGLVVVALLLLAVAGSFAASEAALARVSRAKAAELLENGRRGAAALSRVVEEPGPTLSVATFLRVLSESGAAVAVTLVATGLTPVWWHAGLAAAGVMTALLFALVGVGPRTLGRQHAASVGLVAAPVIAALARVLGPLARLLVIVGNMLTPGPGYRDGPFASEAELRDLVDIAEESELIEPDEREMIHSVFELGDTIAREVMVPRTDLVSVDAGTTLHRAMSLFLRSGFSRVPVIGEGLDDVLGIVYVKDVARRLHVHPESARSQVVDEVMRPAHFVPDSKPVDDLLREMQRTSAHVAVVVDEYGGTAGLVTLEDIVEEVVGEISDEFDAEEPDVEPLEDGVYRVPARMHIEDVGDLFGLDVEDEDVDTVGGLLAKSLGRVPIAGARGTFDGLELMADRFEGRRKQLATVIVRRLPENHGAEHVAAQKEPVE